MVYPCRQNTITWKRKYKKKKKIKMTSHLQPGNQSSVRVLKCPSAVTTPTVFYIKAEVRTIHRVSLNLYYF